MGDFINFAKDFSSVPFQVYGMIVILAFTFFFLGYRMYKFAFLFLIGFLVFFIVWLRGPMGEDMIAKFQGKRPPLFKLPTEADKEKIREQRELMKHYRESLKEVKQGRE
jgi:hypothetical protein